MQRRRIHIFANCIYNAEKIVNHYRDLIEFDASKNKNGYIGFTPEYFTDEDDNIITYYRITFKKMYISQCEQMVKELGLIERKGCYKKQWFYEGGL